MRQILIDAGESTTVAQRVLAEYKLQPHDGHRAVRYERARRGQAALRAAFAEDTAVARTLCYLLVPDYACVNAIVPPARRYAMPAACQPAAERIQRWLARR